MPVSGEFLPTLYLTGYTRSAQVVKSNNGTTGKPNADQNHSPSIHNNEKRAESGASV